MGKWIGLVLVAWALFGCSSHGLDIPDGEELSDEQAEEIVEQVLDAYNEVHSVEMSYIQELDARFGGFFGLFSDREEMTIETVIHMDENESFWMEMQGDVFGEQAYVELILQDSMIYQRTGETGDWESQEMDAEDLEFEDEYDYFDGLQEMDPSEYTIIETEEQYVVYAEATTEAQARRLDEVMNSSEDQSIASQGFQELGMNYFAFLFEIDKETFLPGRFEIVMSGNDLLDGERAVWDQSLRGQYASYNENFDIQSPDNSNSAEQVTEEASQSDDIEDEPEEEEEIEEVDEEEWDEELEDENTAEEEERTTEEYIQDVVVDQLDTFTHMTVTIVDDETDEEFYYTESGRTTNLAREGATRAEWRDSENDELESIEYIWVELGSEEYARIDEGSWMETSSFHSPPLRHQSYFTVTYNMLYNYADQVTRSEEDGRIRLSWQEEVEEFHNQPTTEFQFTRFVTIGSALDEYIDDLEGRLEAQDSFDIIVEAQLTHDSNYVEEIYFAYIGESISLEMEFQFDQFDDVEPIDIEPVREEVERGE